ncbi:hypothetical protein PG301_23550 [Parageobacillus sp. G301]|nr:hypothetical protein PG301_23550 [Parageobacillus sp. G301]
MVHNLNKITLSPSEFFLDDETIYNAGKVNDNRLPFFARMFAVPHPFIVFDGNKRIMAKIKNGEKSFTGYEFPPQLVANSFFSDLEGWFYALLAEMNTFLIMIVKNVPFKEVFCCFSTIK